MVMPAFRNRVHVRANSTGAGDRVGWEWGGKGVRALRLSCWGVEPAP